MWWPGWTPRSSISCAGVGAQGRTGYDPDMMLALLLYAYTHKVRSSREIERLCQTDVAFRVICAGNAPDHSTIARFRQDHAALCEKLFAQVLELCALAGLAQVGVVALDGTKVAANASKGANRGRAQLEAQRAKLEAEIQEMFAQAQAADNDEDDRFGPSRGDELPAGLAGATARQAALDTALAALAEHEAQHRPGKPQVWRARAGRYRAGIARRPGGVGGPPSHQVPHRQVAPLPTKANRWPVSRPSWPGRRPRPRPPAGRRPTGPRSTGPTPTAGSCPSRAAGPGLQRPGRGQLHRHHPRRRRVLRPQRHGPVPAHGGRPGPGGAATGPVGVVLADAGYCSEANLAAPGPVRLIAVKKDRRTRADRATTSGPAPEGLSRRAAMEHAMRTPEGRHLYKQRSWTVEPCFGNLKHNMGFSRFARRGREAARAEWHLVTAGANLLKLFRYYPAAARLA